MPEGSLHWELLAAAPTSFPTDPQLAFLAAASLQFPLQLRRWRAGDQFQPLGMKGKHQKLQDYFSNNKLSRLEKQKVWLLESAGQICWIVGHRLDEGFKVKASGSPVWRFHWQTSS